MEKKEGKCQNGKKKKKKKGIKRATDEEIGEIGEVGKDGNYGDGDSPHEEKLGNEQSSLFSRNLKVGTWKLVGEMRDDQRDGLKSQSGPQPQPQPQTNHLSRVCLVCLVLLVFLLLLLLMSVSFGVSDHLADHDD
ncbi:unnamed protein product [Ambrosiozyma monospora]|uniref:Unnamed protein product n=1 Tax=Ambrosiozyma monospora TaxID=43982 RepID=A0A9W6YUE2_AMBMO|nr:unnamed protein product [Ambrosiozyma monospora]